MLRRRYSSHRTRIAEILELFDREGRALHPTEIGRATGLHFMTASRILESCDECFMRLPRSPDGAQRYHLRPTVRAMTPEQRAALLDRLVLGERLVAWAALFAGLSVAVLGLIGIVIWTA